MTPEARTTTYTASTIGGLLTAVIVTLVAVLAIRGVITQEEGVAWTALGSAVVNAALAIITAIARRYVPEAPDAARRAIEE